MVHRLRPGGEPHSSGDSGAGLLENEQPILRLPEKSFGNLRMARLERPLLRVDLATRTVVTASCGAQQAPPTTRLLQTAALDCSSRQPDPDRAPSRVTSGATATIHATMITVPINKSTFLRMVDLLPLPSDQGRARLTNALLPQGSMESFLSSAWAIDASPAGTP